MPIKVVKLTAAQKKKIKAALKRQAYLLTLDPMDPERRLSAYDFTYMLRKRAG
jgi:hypothetical protein